MNLLDIIWSGLGYELGNLVNWIVGLIEGGLAYIIWKLYKRHSDWFR